MKVKIVMAPTTDALEAKFNALSLELGNRITSVQFDSQGPFGFVVAVFYEEEDKQQDVGELPGGDNIKLPFDSLRATASSAKFVKS